MMPFAFKQVEVFSLHPYRGHPVCVFLESQELFSYEMGCIALWTDFPATTFVSSSKKADYHVEIFDPTTAVHFNGAATLATAWALMESGILKKEVVIQDCDYGLVEVFREEEKLFFTLPKFEILNSIDHTLMKEAIGIDFHEDCCVIQTEGPEAKWIIGCVKNSRNLSRTNTNGSVFREYIRPYEGIVLYAIKDSGVSVRMLAPSGWEDVAEMFLCGSGSVAVAVHIKTSGRHKKTGDTYKISYRPEFAKERGQVFVRMVGDRIQIGGMCRTIFSGTSYAF